MATEMLIIDLFCRVDDQTQDLAKHPQAKLYPSEVITLALLFAIKGVGNRAYYDWLTDNWQHLFLNLPHRTCLMMPHGEAGALVSPLFNPSTRHKPIFSTKERLRHH